ncbi:MAG: radical SAM protein [Desulforhopalus sp.]
MKNKGTKKNDKCIIGGPLHLKLTKKWKNSPLNYLSLTVPFDCNFRCLKCANSLDEQNCSDVPEIQQQMSVEKLLNYSEYEEIIGSFAASGGNTIAVIGEGEPFHPKQVNLTKHIIAIAYKNALNIIIFTNGALLNDDLISFLYDHDVAIVFSIDSLDRDQYTRLTGTSGKVYDAVINNIKKTTSVYQNKKSILKDTHSNEYTATYIGINSVLSLHNRSEIEKITSFLQYDVIHTFGLPLLKGGMSHRYEEFVGTDMNLLSFFDVVKEHSETGGSISYCRSLDKCTIMNNGILINPEGNYGVCNYSEDIKEFGNWRDNKALLDVASSIHRRVDLFFEEQGHFFCLLRHHQAHIFFNPSDQRLSYPNEIGLATHSIDEIAQTNQI